MTIAWSARARSVVRCLVLAAACFGAALPARTEAFDAQSGPPAASAAARARASALDAGAARAGVVALHRLPPEARRTLALIRAGGPFPYVQDGRVFGNRERRLPRKPRGYYREYTVPTPGAPDRGARRIVAGGGNELYYYTEDHYRSFRRIVE